VIEGGRSGRSCSLHNIPPAALFLFGATLFARCASFLGADRRAATNASIEQPGQNA
jgi:hypothetical protein